MGWIMRDGAIAGLAGGLAEIAWISGLSAAGGTPAAEVARGITMALAPSIAATSFATTVGLVVHLVLAMALGATMLCLWDYFLRKLFPKWSGAAFAIASLAAIWLLNFHFVLPILSPEFLSLVPAGSGLVSKLLFALAFLAALQVSRRSKKMQAHQF